MPTDRDLELAAAHLLATEKTHTKADLDTLAELLAQVRAESYEQGHEAGRRGASELISRSEALARIPGASERARNYELEEMLADVFEHRFVIAEWCPFNGIFCEWLEHAPQAVIDAQIAYFTDHAVEVRALGLDPQYHVEHLRAELARRASAQLGPAMAEDQG